MSVILLGLWGCSVLRVEPGDAVAPVYPHPEGFEAGPAHGEVALRAPEDCAACHRLDGRSTPPPCESCHLALPHPEGWRAGASHGQGLASDAAAMQLCRACHERSSSIAQSSAACTRCHGSFPHEPGWVQGGAHGRYALERGGGSAVCGPCHGSELSGGTAEVGCSSCHPPYPHPVGWVDPAAHGVSWSADPSGCAGCHESDGDDVPACSACHAGFPHPTDQLLTHPRAVERLGEGPCMGCHQPGDGPSTLAATCSRRCHWGEP